MDHTYWLKQTSKPLYDDILWSRPETKIGAGKLLIIGGNEYAFSAPGTAFNVADIAGAGVIRVLLPDAVRKVVKNLLPDADYSPSTRSGSFAKKALSDMLSLASWSDTVLLAGDLGRNSETAIALESFVDRYADQLVVTQDAVEYFHEHPGVIIDRPQTLIVLSLSQLQKLFINAPSITPVTLSMSTLQLVEALHVFTNEHSATIVTLHKGYVFVASRGQVSTTVCDKDIWRVETAARSAVFYMQNPEKVFESTTTAAYEYANNTKQA